jgi:hypothetical protein
VALGCGERFGPNCNATFPDALALIRGRPSSAETSHFPLRSVTTAVTAAGGCAGNGRRFPAEFATALAGTRKISFASAVVGAKCTGTTFMTAMCVPTK